MVLKKVSILFLSLFVLVGILPTSQVVTAENTARTSSGWLDWTLRDGWWYYGDNTTRYLDINVTIKNGDTVVKNQLFNKIPNEADHIIEGIIPPGYEMDSADPHSFVYDDGTPYFMYTGKDFVNNGEGRMEITINVTPNGESTENDVHPVYRVYNPNNGEHLYTLSLDEAKNLISVGWKDEGVSWKAGKSKGLPAYRLYNSNSGEHFYTSLESEYESVAAAGWTKEGIAFYSSAEISNQVYRLFNPNATGAGSHHYTAKQAEVSNLYKAGWIQEGTAFYGK